MYFEIAFLIAGWLIRSLKDGKIDEAEWLELGQIIADRYDLTFNVPGMGDKD